MLEIFEVPKSSFVQKIAYDGNDIFVKISKKGWYKYSNLPKSVFDNFCNAPSKGTFLNEKLKPIRTGVRCSSPKL